MAKRKRLGPAVITGQGGDAALTQTLETQTPPIARVAGEAAAEAAVRELSDELANALAEGRMVQDIALDDIDEMHLSRDRIVAVASELEALIASIQARGQQMPIEVVDLGADQNPRYGLISGWRRLTALKALRQRTNAPQFETVRAVLRQPQGAADAYLSMVEENELRVGLSYYERAQVAARASDFDVFDGSADAVQALFPTASKAKRSKINAFVRVFRVLDPVLKFPDTIPERLGLRIAKALDAGQGGLLYDGLREVPSDTPADEHARLEKLLGLKTGSKDTNRVAQASFPGDVSLTRSRGTLKLSGAGVDATLERELTDWLRERQKDR